MVAICSKELIIVGSKEISRLECGCGRRTDASAARKNMLM
jgi:hypothetical protein